MNNERVIYDDGEHKCVIFSYDNEEVEDSFLAVNQYLIVQNRSAILIDPGSMSVYDEVYDGVSKYVDIDDLKYIFYSHQDPDVAGSIGRWSVSCGAKQVVSKLWVRFMSHYGLMNFNKLLTLEDKGAKIHFGKDYLQFIPAHFLHSPGNFSLYDSHSKILFSGDIGASITERYGANMLEADFDEIKENMEAFHKRYMAGNTFCRSWVQKVKKLDVQTMAPQHGSLLSGDEYLKFLSWFENLECGGDLVEQIY
ncbi:MAG: MBL fold metallo-hydrolase [Sulfurospirillum sp.]